jgi:hypothetical protein
MELQNTNSKIQITNLVAIGYKESNFKKQDPNPNQKKIPKPTLNIV